MGNFGIKASQQGSSVETAADYELSLSSSWPTLKIAKHGSFTDAGATIPHGMAYEPAFLIFDNLLDVSVDQFAVSTDPSSAGIDSTNLTIPSQAAGYKGHYYIFDWPLGKEYTAPVLSTTATSSPQPTNIGIKVSLPGKSVRSRDLRDFALHTNTRSFTIQKSGAATASGLGNPVTITHDLGYEPFSFVWYKSSGKWYLHPFEGANLTGDITTTTIQFGSTFTNDFTYVIFKDPFLLEF